MAKVIGNGVYTFSEAARLCRLKPATVRNWFLERKTGGKPVFHGDYSPKDGKHSISFLDLVDVFIAGHLLENGVRLPVIRRVYARLQKLLDQNHPFCYQSFPSSGRVVFLRLAEEDGDIRLTELLSKSKTFQRITSQFYQQIDYDPATRLAALWRIADGIVLDPQRCAGAPIIDRARVLTDILAASYSANGEDAAMAAWEYAVAPEDVMKAVRFESGLAA